MAMVLGIGGAPVAAAKATVAIPSTPRRAAILTVISGDVLTRGTGSAFAAATDGAVIYVGATIRTGAGARAVITLFEGSTIELEPASDITIEEATARGGSTIVQLSQSLGRSWHVVTHLTTPDSRYEVKTPAATASVRGTSFEVAVLDDGTGPATTVATTEGLVATADAAATSEVLVAPAQLTTVRPNSAPEPSRSAPEADRVVTVSAVSESAIVVDPFGRANGFKNGAVVAQTPGARVRFDSRTIVITLPNVPNGVFATTAVTSAGSPVSVTTTVADKGEEPVTVTTAADAGGDSTVAVEVSTTSGKPMLRALGAAETKTISDARVDPTKAIVDASNAPTPRAAGEPRATAAPTKRFESTPRPAGTQRRPAVPTRGP
jgi:hypothetical protein